MECKSQQVPFLKQFNVRKDIEQTQTGVTWSKPINDKMNSMPYLGNRQVTQYQSIPKSTQDASINHAGGVIDFERNYLVLISVGRVKSCFQIPR